MKRLIAFLVVLCLLSAFFVTASAAGQLVMSLEPSSKTVKAGEVVRLNLEFDNNTGKDVSVFDFTLYYDTTRLEFLSVTPFIKNKLNDSYLGEIETSMNKDFLYVMYIDDFTSTSQSPITKDQKKILSLNFRARPDAPMGDATFEPKSPTATDFEMENNFPIKFEATKISVVGDPTTTPPPTTVKTDASGNTVTAITTARQGTSAKTTKFVMKTTKGEITIIPVTTEEQTTTEKTSAPTFTNGNPGDDDDSDVGDDNDFTMWIIIIAVLVLVAGAGGVIFMIYSKNKKLEQ